LPKHAQTPLNQRFEVVCNMDKIIVYVDDAEHAQQLLTPLVAQQAAGRHWVLVACAPRMTHRISKWVSHSARESWRSKWADRLFDQLVPAVGLRSGQFTTVLAKTPLPELTEELQAQIRATGAPPAPVVDVRKPRTDTANTASPASVRTEHAPRLSTWPRVLGSVITGCGTLWALGLD
jgi:hypothetical protein